MVPAKCGWQWVTDYGHHSLDVCGLSRDHEGPHSCPCGAALPIQYGYNGQRLYILTK